MVQLDHLAAHGTGFPEGRVTIVAVGQINAHFLGSLHLETVHSLTSLGNVDLIVIGIAHLNTLLLCFSGKQGTFRMESVFFFP